MKKKPTGTIKQARLARRKVLIATNVLMIVACAASITVTIGRLYILNHSTWSEYKAILEDDFANAYALYEIITQENESESDIIASLYDAEEAVIDGLDTEEYEVVISIFHAVVPSRENCYTNPHETYIKLLAMREYADVVASDPDVISCVIDTYECSDNLSYLVDKYNYYANKMQKDAIIYNDTFICRLIEDLRVPEDEIYSTIDIVGVDEM
jgi:hypothetical protein